jgi:apolipoprotein N-acyltransferase
MWMKLLKRLNFAYLYSPLCGLLVVFSFPTFNLYPLAWVAMIPLLVILYDKSGMQSFKIGLLFGTVYFFGTLYWIYHSLNQYGSISLVPSLLFVFILSMYLSLYPAIFCALYSAVIRKTDLPALFVAPVLWTSLEFLRSYALSGFPWSSLGYSQYQFLVFIQSTDITGIYGISFLIVSVNGAVADYFIMKTRMREKPLYSRFHTFAGWFLLFTVLTANLCYGLYRLYQDRPGHRINVAVIQGNIEQDKKWDAAYQQDVLEIYRNLSSEIASKTGSASDSLNLVVWPETAVPFFFGTNRELSDELVTFQRNLNAYLLFGSITKKGDADDKFSNSTILLTKEGSVSFIYDKIHLVPFGEYVPLRRLLFFIDKLVVGVGDYIPGDSYTRAVTPFGSFGTPICYEIIFPGLVRKYYIKGGDFMVNITNDAWFGKTSGPYQHFSMAIFRAIENRKPVIRAANTGISGFIDSSGRILQVSDIFVRNALKSNIKTDRTLSFYTKYGDLFSFFCIVASMLLFINIRKN